MLVSITARAALAAILAIAVAFAVADRAAPHVLAAGDCTVDATMDSEEQAFLVLINNYRAQNNLPPFVASYTLTKASAWKSKDLGTNNYFAHDDLSRTWVQRIRDCGYGFNTSLGENIAAGYNTAQQVFDGWRSSPGHNANMLGANYTSVGIGRFYVAGSTYGWYWTTDFGGFSDGWATVTATFTSTPTLTPTPTTVPATATASPTRTPMRTPTATPTNTPTVTATQTVSNTPTATSTPLADIDGDGVANSVDNCPTVYNPGQGNTDGNNAALNQGGQDSLGDACDNNISGDGYTNAQHTALGKNPLLYCVIMRVDYNGDGTVDGLDLNILAKFLQTYTRVDPPNGVDVGVPMSAQRVDANGDLVVNGLDLNVVSKNYLKTASMCP